MAWKKGQSGNPKGRPVGTRNSVTNLGQSLLDEAVKDITEKCLEKARKGDLMAIKLVMERVCPPRRDRPVEFNLPELDDKSIDHGGA
ncbi:MAG: DUF5681 domain-containing protein, partial [Alphaproteobacteria bacterium]|nr:DUF5681 domain-containing protein [Alphaproteobacteria bacterium]